MTTDIRINLATLQKTFKETATLTADKTTYTAQFDNDIEGQVVYSEKGSNIIVTAYATQDVTYQKVEIVKEKESAETKGKNKGKFACVVKTYNAIVEDGVVTGFEENPASVSKTKYYKEEYIVTTYQILNAKNKVIETTFIDVTGESKTIVNTDKVLGTITYKNANEYATELDIISENNGTYNLLKKAFAPVKSKNKYTGTWLTEEVESTSANETFTLGANKEELDPDVIKYNLLTKQGKDTVNLVEGSNINIELENDGGLVKTFTKSGNNVVLTLGKPGEYEGNSAYTKEEHIVNSNYDVTIIKYQWKDSTHVYEQVSKTTEHWGKESYLLVKQDMKETYGVDFNMGTNIYYKDGSGKLYQGGDGILGEITLKNYLKLGEDSVMINDISLEDIINGDVLYQNGKAKKANKLFDTAYNDNITGGKKADKIMISNKGNDVVVGGAGNDTITITKDASGVKDLEFDKGSGKDTVIIEGNTGALLYNHAIDEGHEGFIS